MQKKCLRCFTCMAERPTTQTRRCTVNPLIGREIEGTDIVPAAVKKNVLIVGGGLAGCEAAIHLAQEGKKVQLVEMRPELAPDANIRHRPILMQMIEKYVEAHTGYQGMEVTKDGVICRDADGNEVLVPGKSVVCAVGQRANRECVNALRDGAPIVREIGDCVRPGNITNAIYMGYHAALDI